MHVPDLRTAEEGRDGLTHETAALSDVIPVLKEFSEAWESYEASLDIAHLKIAETAAHKGQAVFKMLAGRVAIQRKEQRLERFAKSVERAETKGLIPPSTLISLIERVGVNEEDVALAHLRNLDRIQQKKAKIEARISNRILHAESRMKRPMTKEEMKAWRLKTFGSRKQASP